MKKKATSKASKKMKKPATRDLAPLEARSSRVKAGATRHRALKRR